MCLAAHVHETGTFGPLDVYCHVSHLLVAWLCYKPAVVDWHVALQKPRGHTRLFRLYDLLKLVPTSGRRRLGLCRLQRGLSIAGEPPARKVCLKVPPELGLNAARAVLHHCRVLLMHDCPQRWFWMRRHLVLCSGARATFASIATNQSLIIRQSNIHGLRSKPRTWVSEAISGRDLIRVKKYWKLQAWRPPVDMARTFVLDVCGWLSSCHQPYPSCDSL